MEYFSVLVETPKGSLVKYTYNPSTHFLELTKLLPAGMSFPFDFGFIPDTIGQDGDPIDVIIVSEFSGFPGCMIECNIIGAIDADQSEKAGKKKKIRNDRYIAIPCLSVVFEKVKSVKELPTRIIKDIEDFFINYNRSAGKIFRIIQTIDAPAAQKNLQSNLLQNFKTIRNGYQKEKA